MNSLGEQIFQDMQNMTKAYASANGIAATPAPAPKPEPVKPEPKPIKAPPRYKSLAEIQADDCTASIKVAALIKQLNGEIYNWACNEEGLDHKDAQIKFMEAVADAVADEVYDGETD